MLTTPMPELGQLGGMAFERDLDPPTPHRVHEVRLRRPGAEPREQRGLRRAQPQPIQRAGLPGHLDQHRARRRVVHVEGELVVGAELAVEVGEAGDRQLRQLGRGALCDPLAAPAGTGDRAVDQHHLAVGAEARIRLEPPRAQLQGEAERLQRVLRSIGARAAMGEGEGCGHALIVTRVALGPPFSSACVELPMPARKWATEIWEVGLT